MPTRIAPPPDGPHGVYDFGFPDVLVRINFPNGTNDNISEPWFWYLTVQTPRYFQYLSPNVGGHGWQCEEFLPIIKILGIDTRPLTPTLPVGFTSIEDAVVKTNANPGKVSTDAWGRFKFDPNKKQTFFWDLVGTKKPEFSKSKGLLTQKQGQRGQAININIRETVQKWASAWNANALLYNSAFQGVSNQGYSVVLPNSAYDIPAPNPNETLPALQKALGENKQYFGSIPPTTIFQTGQPAFWKQAWCFTLNVGQLDGNKWDMSVWPPQDTTDPGYLRPPSAISRNFGGYDPSPIASNFPLHGPIIV